MSGNYLNSEETEQVRDLMEEVKTLRAENAELRKTIKEGMKDTESNGKTAAADSWTKEKIMAVKSITKRQRLIREHMDLFK